MISGETGCGKTTQVIHSSLKGTATLKASESEIQALTKLCYLP